jgi:hypothetical protein
MKLDLWEIQAISVLVEREIAAQPAGSSPYRQSLEALRNKVEDFLAPPTRAHPELDQ